MDTLIRLFIMTHELVVTSMAVLVVWIIEGRWIGEIVPEMARHYWGML